MQDVIYVLYYNGEMYDKYNRRPVYLKERNAKQVLTSESKRIAEREVDKWWKLTNSENNRLIDDVRVRFKIKEFVQKI